MQSVNPYEPPSSVVEPADTAPSPADGLPWESEGCSAASWLKTAWLATTAPAVAFAKMIPGGEVRLALGYVLVGSILGGIALFVSGAIAYLSFVIEYPEVPVARIVGHLIGLFLRHVLRFSLLVTLATLVMASVQHAILKLMDGETRSFATTFRTVAYAAGSLAILLAIPVVGCLAIFLLLNVNMRGLEQSQQCLEAKALLATIVSIPVAIGVVALGFIPI